MCAPQGPLGIDNEEATEGNASILEEDAIVAGDLHVAVCDERDLEVRSKATLLAALGCPCEVRVLGVGGDGCTKVRGG